MVLFQRYVPSGGMAEGNDRRRDGVGRCCGRAHEKALQRKSGAAFYGPPAGAAGAAPGTAQTGRAAAPADRGAGSGAAVPADLRADNG